MSDDMHTLRARIIKYKRIIIQLTVIIIACIVILYCNPWQYDLKFNLISGSIGIIIAGMVSIVEYLYLKKDKEFFDKNAETIQEIRKLEASIVALSKGVEGVELYKRRTDIDFTKLVQESKKIIRIYTTGLKFISNYDTVLNEAVKRNVSVQILGLNPNNLFIATRYHELGISQVEDFFSEIDGNVRQIYNKLKEIQDQNIRDRYEVRLYVNQPTYMLFQFDDCLIISFILKQTIRSNNDACNQIQSGRSRDQIHIQFDLRVHKVKEMASDFVTSFESIWAEADKLDENMVTKLERRYNFKHMSAKGANRQTNFYSLIRERNAETK